MRSRRNPRGDNRFSSHSALFLKTAASGSRCSSSAAFSVLFGCRFLSFIYQKIYGLSSIGYNVMMINACGISLGAVVSSNDES